MSLIPYIEAEREEENDQTYNTDIYNVVYNILFFFYTLKIKVLSKLST